MPGARASFILAEALWGARRFKRAFGLGGHSSHILAIFLIAFVFDAAVCAIGTFHDTPAPGLSTSKVARSAIGVGLCPILAPRLICRLSIGSERTVTAIFVRSELIGRADSVGGARFRLAGLADGARFQVAPGISAAEHEHGQGNGANGVLHVVDVVVIASSQGGGEREKSAGEHGVLFGLREWVTNADRERQGGGSTHFRCT